MIAMIICERIQYRSSTSDWAYHTMARKKRVYLISLSPILTPEKERLLFFSIFYPDTKMSILVRPNLMRSCDEWTKWSVLFLVSLPESLIYRNKNLLFSALVMKLPLLVYLDIGLKSKLIKFPFLFFFHSFFVFTSFWQPLQ
jgi:hypothetical protein